MKAYEMKTALIAGALISLGLASTALADKYHNDPSMDSSKSAGQTSKLMTSADSGDDNSKRIPGRDCKLYNGGTRQHMMPQYEVGNADQPECIPGSE